MSEPPRNRNWLWYFAALLVLAVVVIVLLGVAKWHIQQQRLTPEQLEAARRLWTEEGPADYELLYTVRRGREEKVERYEVRVRQRQTEFVSLNGAALMPVLYPNYGMNTLFSDLWGFLNTDARLSKPGVFQRAVFDAIDGHLLSFERRGADGREYLDIEVQAVRPLPPKGR
jgi:hypothetical protein